MLKFKKNILKGINIKVLLTIALLTTPLFISEVIAQSDPPHPSDEGIPIDGLGFLAVLGVLYGVKKLRQKKK